MASKDRISFFPAILEKKIKMFSFIETDYDDVISSKLLLGIQPDTGHLFPKKYFHSARKNCYANVQNCSVRLTPPLPPNNY